MSVTIDGQRIERLYYKILMQYNPLSPWKGERGKGEEKITPGMSVHDYQMSIGSDPRHLAVELNRVILQKTIIEQPFSDNGQAEDRLIRWRRVKGEDT